MDNFNTSLIVPRREKEGEIFESGLFGVNLEITRKGFFGGLSAQMLNNRKLFAGSIGVDGWECREFERVLDRPEESLCNSNFVILHSGRMSQSSQVIAFNKNEDYEATVWVKALSEKCQITFGALGAEQTFDIERDDAMYRKLLFVFSGNDAVDGEFSISVKGDVAVFEASILPVDNFYGMRRDVVEQLRAVNPVSVRFPGGCAADHFDWKESLKAPELRKPTGAGDKWFLFRDSFEQDTLDIGINEFIMLCRELDAEPEYTVSLVLSDGEDARRLVEYCNGDVSTEYGAIRHGLGFDAFGIRLWYVGNEAYFFGGEYADSVKAAQRTDELIEAMKKADASIKTVIGLTWGTNYKTWALDFIKTLKSDYDYVSYHDYIGILPDNSQGENGMATCEMLENNFIDGKCFGLSFYRDELFVNCFDNVRICVDEWNYAWGKDSSNALFFSNALQFHFLAKSKSAYHIDRAEFFMPVNEGMITVNGTECRLESTGEMFRLMQGHKNGRVIGCDSDNSALDLLCTDHGEYLYISAVNRCAEPCRLEVDGYEITECVGIRIVDYSFESNEFYLEQDGDGTLFGHSAVFLTCKK